MFKSLSDSNEAREKDLIGLADGHPEKVQYSSPSKSLDKKSGLHDRGDLIPNFTLNGLSDVEKSSVDSKKRKDVSSAVNVDSNRQ